jgi:hypothetical protein
MLSIAHDADTIPVVPFKACSCGRAYTPETWKTLPLCGVQDDDVEIMELRTCPCGSTIAIVLGPSTGGVS